MARILITGASSVVGHYLLPALAAEGHSVTALSRSAHEEQDGVRWLQVDAARTPLREVLPEGCDALIHLAPLPLLPHLLSGLPAGLGRIVATGTTSIFTKMDSSTEKDRRLVAQQRGAEDAVSEYCRQHGLVLTVLRPTLVYDGVRDKNVARIGRLVRRFGVFPVAAPGAGLRQPLHAADLAAACHAALAAKISHTYNLAGAERLAYRAMLERIFTAQGRRPRVLPLPLGLYRLAIRAARVLPRYRDLTPEVADRMNQDMVFDYAEAARDLGFKPRGFQPETGA